MAGTKKLPHLTPTEVRETLSDWFAERRPDGVELRERTDPACDPDARHRLAYKAVIEPESLERARVELRVTADGAVAVGLETRARIAQRLGVGGGRGHFAADHEPCRMTRHELRALLDAVADGDIAISSVVLPVLGLVETRAVMSRDRLEELGAKGYAHRRWLEGPRGARLPSTRHLLRFYKW